MAAQPRTELQSRIRILCGMLPDNSVRNLAVGVEGISNPSDHALATAVQGIAVASHRERAMDMLRYWRSHVPELTPAALSYALEVAAHICKEERNRVHIETVWTGPEQTELIHRSPAQAVYDVLDAAREELIVVSYATRRVQPVLDRLHAAASRDVRIMFIIERGKEYGGKLAYDPLKQSGLPDVAGIELYYWPLTKRPKTPEGDVGSLHAKCIVADRHIALVTSANLTDYALSINIEMGLKIEGGDAPRQIAEQFVGMVEMGILEKITS